MLSLLQENGIDCNTTTVQKEGNVWYTQRFHDDRNLTNFTLHPPPSPLPIDTKIQRVKHTRPCN
ncbi:hypothetical protein BDV40DRAFT_257227 [Aspergillus tamarii]|uniref:Uncharacterized protein n=1 Tax=Aspergillus tamarii TaxID=41984 RepID=A0A5N6V5C3_ASPTM|nr:hypothetical protein BDV40DRAFT_257227 [Aspergillus tamarii]